MRFVSGVCSGNANLIAPVFIGEMCPNTHKYGRDSCVSPFPMESNFCCGQCAPQGVKRLERMETFLSGHRRAFQMLQPRHGRTDLLTCNLKKHGADARAARATGHDIVQATTVLRAYADGLLFLANYGGPDSLMKGRRLRLDGTASAKIRCTYQTIKTILLTHKLQCEVKCGTRITTISTLQ